MGIGVVMKERRILPIIWLMLFCLGCVPVYQRNIEGIYKGSRSVELFPILDKVSKEHHFTFKGSFDKPQNYTIIADYIRYDVAIQKNIYLEIFLKDIDESTQQTEFLIRLNGPGREEEIKKSVDKIFEALVSGVVSELESSRLQIMKES
jgi:hypothetical protein